MSLDALRGFDMCWILGLDAIIKSGAAHLKTLESVPESIKENVLAPLSTQLEHVKWEGLVFYDVIFPLFLFLSGVSMAISVARRQQQFGTFSAAKHLIIRAIVICIIGVIYSGGLRGVTWGKTDWESGVNTIRFLGVLQRIGIASAAAGLLSLWLGWRGLTVALVTILLGYWAMLTQITVPDVGKGNFAPEMNFANYIDKLYLPGRKYPEGATHDPEGLLSTLPAIATALLGLLTGKWLFGPATPGKKVLMLFVVGAALTALGFGWHQAPENMTWFPTFPIIKKLWTSSFVLAAGGISMMLLALFYAVIDIAGLRLWARPFVWVGANPIALYIASGMGAFRSVAVRLTGTCPSPWTWVPPLVAFLLMLATARFLYRRGIHIRI
jgi:predicted acyltransferase